MAGQDRVRPGVPTGGQFASTGHEEPAVDLAAGPTYEPRWSRHPEPWERHEPESETQEGRDLRALLNDVESRLWADGSASAADPRLVAIEHLVISTSGWHCDICGVEANGQTDDQGIPVMEGDSVRHTS